jgi:hypothetical protein
MEILKNVPGFDSNIELIKVREKDVENIATYCECDAIWSEEHKAIVLSGVPEVVGFGDLIVSENDYISKDVRIKRLGFYNEIYVQLHYVERDYNSYYNYQELQMKVLRDELAQAYKMLGPKALNMKDTSNKKDLIKKQKKYNKVAKKTIDELFQD